jgi:hypothetical protein
MARAGAPMSNRGDEREREHQPERLQLEAEDVDLGEHPETG